MLLYHIRVLQLQPQTELHCRDLTLFQDEVHCLKNPFITRLLESGDINTSNDYSSNPMCCWDDSLSASLLPPQVQWSSCNIFSTQDHAAAAIAKTGVPGNTRPRWILHWMMKYLIMTFSLPLHKESLSIDACTKCLKRMKAFSRRNRVNKLIKPVENKTGVLKWFLNRL